MEISKVREKIYELSNLYKLKKSFFTSVGFHTIPGVISTAGDDITFVTYPDVQLPGGGLTYTLNGSAPSGQYAHAISAQKFDATTVPEIEILINSNTFTVSFVGIVSVEHPLTGNTTGFSGDGIFVNNNGATNIYGSPGHDFSDATFLNAGTTVYMSVDSALKLKIGKTKSTSVEVGTINITDQSWGYRVFLQGFQTGVLDVNSQQIS